MFSLNRFQWVLVVSLMLGCAAVYAEQTHAFGDDIAQIEIRSWILVGITIGAGVLGRYTVGNPGDDLPRGVRGFVATSILSSMAGLLTFWLCETYRGWGGPLSDGLEIGMIFFAAYNNRKTVEWFEKEFSEYLRTVWTALRGGKGTQ